MVVRHLPVHGGFSDGDVLFSGATVTAVTNWQNMQVNDPARDLAWIFGKIDEDHAMRCLRRMAA